MSDEEGVERFVKDPRLLIELCRKVVGRLASDPDHGSVVEKEAQLREISRSIERLEKIGVPIPDALRAEKTRLAAALSIQTELSEGLGLLATGFGEILKELQGYLGRGVNRTSTNRKPESERSSSPRTGMKVFREYIIRALRKFGGRAQAAEVMDEVERQIKDKLQPGDFKTLRDGKTIAWQNRAHWERLRMVKEGVLRSNSPRGIWELSEKDR